MIKKESQIIDFFPFRSLHLLFQSLAWRVYWGTCTGPAQPSHSWSISAEKVGSLMNDDPEILMLVIDFKSDPYTKITHHTSWYGNCNTWYKTRGAFICVNNQMNKSNLRRCQPDEDSPRRHYDQHTRNSSAILVRNSSLSLGVIPKASSHTEADWIIFSFFVIWNLERLSKCTRLLCLP